MSLKKGTITGILVFVLAKVLTRTTLTYFLTESSEEKFRRESEATLQKHFEDNAKYTNLEDVDEDYDYIEPYEKGLNYFEDENYTSAIISFTNAILSYEGNKNELDVIQYGVGASYYKLGEYETAIEKIKVAINTRKSYGSENTDIFIWYLVLSESYLELFDYENALQNYFSALDEYRITGAKQNVNETYFLERISMVYCDMGEYEKCIEYAKQVINFDTNRLIYKPSYNVDLSNAYENMGRAYENLGEHEKAAEAFELSKNISSKIE